MNNTGENRGTGLSESAAAESATAEIERTTLAAISQARQRNAKAIEQAAKLIVTCLESDSLIFTAGAGHSLGAVSETFYRAGGLACVYPLFLLELLPLNGAHASTQAERTTGLAAQVLREAAPTPSDALVIFSTSGINNYPVELAVVAKSLHIPVVAITSRAASDAAPRRAGSALLEHADVVLDTGVPPGDVSFPNPAPRTAPLSSILNAYLWNLILGAAAELTEASRRELPLWHSANTPEGDGRNADLLQRYQQRIPALCAFTPDSFTPSRSSTDLP